MNLYTRRKLLRLLAASGTTAWAASHLGFLTNDGRAASPLMSQGGALDFRKGKLINLALSGWDFEKHVIRVAAGRDVQAVEVQVGRFGQAIRKSDADQVPRSDFKPRPWH